MEWLLTKTDDDSLEDPPSSDEEEAATPDAPAVIISLVDPDPLDQEIFGNHQNPDSKR